MFLPVLISTHYSCPNKNCLYFQQDAGSPFNVMKYPQLVESSNENDPVQQVCSSSENTALEKSLSFPRLGLFIRT